VSDHAREARDERRAQRVVVRFAKLSHRPRDAAALRRDRRVVGALHAQRVLVGPRARKEAVGVRVDEARREHAVAHLDDAEGGVAEALRVELRGGAHGHDAVAVFHKHRAVVHEPEAARIPRGLAGDRGQRAVEGEKLAGVAEVGAHAGA
jgi:hypothetical protein